MLRELLLLALTGFCLAQAVGLETRTADVEMLHKQKKIYELFFFIEQPKIVGSEMYEMGYTYDIENNIDMYTEKMFVREFLFRFKFGMLKRGALFTVYNEEHRNELLSLFRLFYTAKDFDTFYKTACFARIYMNEGMFLTAFTTAVLFRPDCKYLQLPPLYEIYPHFFFDHEIIQKAHHIKMTMDHKKTFKGNAETFLIDMNYTQMCNRFQTFENEYKLNYFMEDIELNNYYYYFRTAFPFWLSMKDFHIVPEHIRGELYLTFHQQMLARYYLERLSNGLGLIDDFDLSRYFMPSFYSNLVYPNGVSVPKRDFMSLVPFYKYKYVKEVETMEMRILAAIDSGFVMDREGKQFAIYTPEGLNILGNIIEGNFDSCNTRFYGAVDALYRDIFGFNFNCKSKNCFVPSVLQMYSTSMRDPAFYRLYKRIINYFLRYKCHVPTYDLNELEFTGVKIENVFTDKIFTFFEKFDTVIDNAVTVNNWKDAMSFNIMARQYRLSYKPFTYRFDIKSDRNVKGMVKIFLGPYFEHYENDFMFFKENWMNFFALDQFIVDLKPGMNTIERLSTESACTMNEMFPGDKFYKKLMKAIEGNEPFTYTDKMFSFPNRLLFPKGTTDGMKFKFFFFITPIDEAKLTTLDLPVFGKFLYDGRPMTFPLDRPFYTWYFQLPNAYLTDVKIFHLKGEEHNFMSKGMGTYGMDDKFMFDKTMDDKFMMNEFMDDKFTKNKFMDDKFTKNKFMDDKFMTDKYDTKYGTHRTFDKFEKPFYTMDMQHRFNV